MSFISIEDITASDVAQAVQLQPKYLSRVDDMYIGLCKSFGAAPQQSINAIVKECLLLYLYTIVYRDNMGQSFEANALTGIQQDTYMPKYEAAKKDYLEYLSKISYNILMDIPESRGWASGKISRG